MLLLRRRFSAGAAIVTIVLAGCQPVAPTTPVPAPTFRCTPEAGGAEFDCSQAQYDDMVAKDKLYAEAEAVYRRFFAEDERILRAGGIEEPTPVLLETTTGAFLEDSMDYYRSLLHDRSKLVGGEVVLAHINRRPGISKEGSVVAMEVCIDASTAQIEVAGDVVGPGRTGIDTVYFGREGVLRIQGADGEEVQEC